MEYRISFIKEKCVQCFACETACKSFRGTEPGVKLRTVRINWQGEFPRIRSSAVSIACAHCHEPACLPACPSSAITAGNGLVTVDRESCTGCRLCLRECPFEAPQFGKDGKMIKCDLCSTLFDPLKEAPPCVKTCPTGALIMTPVSRI
jgi:Fe-S-cluster-containing dehydrogenase component